VSATPDAPSTERPALYVHLGFDGGIFVLRDSGRSAWVTEPQLEEELDALAADAGLVLYTRDHPDQDPPPLVERTFRKIVDRRLPMRLLAEPNPEVVAAQASGATALMRAAYADDPPAVTDLVRRAVPVDARDADGSTALMYAANRGSERVATALIDAGANVNAEDAQGSTPLMFAAQHGFDRLVRLLLAHGADPSRRGSHGLTAEGFASQNGHDTVAAILAQA
jgi:ankyrin repeat protein